MSVFLSVCLFGCLPACLHICPFSRRSVRTTVGKVFPYRCACAFFRGASIHVFLTRSFFSPWHTIHIPCRPSLRVLYCVHSPIMRRGIAHHQVAESRPYNEKVDVYSYGVILWEMTTLKKPFDGMGRDRFFSQVVRGSHRPPINKKWPKPWAALMQVSRSTRDLLVFCFGVVVFCLRFVRWPCDALFGGAGAGRERTGWKGLGVAREGPRVQPIPIDKKRPKLWSALMQVRHAVVCLCCLVCFFLPDFVCWSKRCSCCFISSYL